MSNKKDRRKIENILREPLTRHRFMLNSKIRAAQQPEDPTPFALDDLKTYLAGIKSTSPEYKKEVSNILEAVQVGKAPQAPQFDTPEKQLAWGAGLAYLKVNPEIMQSWDGVAEDTTDISRTPLWKQITSTKTAYQELLSHAHHIREALRDKDTKYLWGEPGTGFAYSRKSNIINIDLMQTMIVGFEHARADVFREIGHAFLSVSYPKRMMEVYREMQPLRQKASKASAKKGPELKPEEYKRLRSLSTEWQLRHMMFNAAEENVANRFVSNMAQQMLQDYSVSLNNTAVTNRAIGLTRLPEDKNASPELRRYMNLCNTVQLSFFQNNELFENTEKGWSMVGVDPNLVRKTKTLLQRPDDAKDDQDGISHADFEYLRELCQGPDGLENLQPKAHERLYGWNNLMNRVSRLDKDRKAIIEEIWKLYAEDLIKKILEQANDQVEQNLEKAQEKQREMESDEQSQEQDQDGEEQEGEDGQDSQDQDGQQQDGDPQDGQDQDGQEQGGEGGQESSQSGGKPQKSKDKKGKPQRGEQQGEPPEDFDINDYIDDDTKNQDNQDQDGQEQDGDPQDGQEGQPQDGEGKDQDAQEGEGQDGETPQDSQDGEPQEGAESQIGADEDESVPVEGAGDMPSVDDATEMPSDETDPNADGQDADGQDADGEDADGQDADGQDADGDDADGDAKTMEELEDEAKKAEQAEDGQDADADGQDQDGEDGQDGKESKSKQKSKKKSNKPGKEEGEPLGDLAKKSWSDYPKRVAELAGPINKVRRIFKEIQKRQLQRKAAFSKTLDILPENAEVKERFNLEAHRNLTIKKISGGLEENDLKRFHRDEPKLVPTEIDIVIMIDGSGSMGSAGFYDGRRSSNPSPLDSALQSSVILYEAAAGKDMNMNIYVGMWGNSNPPILIKPGDDRKKIGQAIERSKTGLNSGTNFAPAVKKVAEVIGEQRGKSGTLTGFTHVLVLSDGDIFDDIPSKEKINTMFQSSDKITFDVAIIGSSHRGTSMEKMAESIKARKPQEEVGVVLGDNPEQVPMDIVGLLLRKIQKCGSFQAIPNSKKRRAMKKALNRMGKKK